jgi:RHS repeat-associated protein
MSVESKGSPAEDTDGVIIDPQRVPCLIGRRLIGDPVDVVTGANTDITVDFVLHGPLPLRWRRYYNSGRSKMKLALGWGQTHEFDRTLTRDLDGFRYTDPLGSEIVFPPLEVGERAANAGLLLRRVSESGYEILQSGEPIQEFEFNGSGASATLSRLRKGDAYIRFRYGSDGLLREIVDSLKRSIVVDSAPDGRVVSVLLASSTEKNERRTLMVYEYDRAGNPIAGRDLYNATLRFAWDQDNRMVRRTDRRGYSFHFEYDQEGRCVHSCGDDGLFEVYLDYRPEVKTTIVRRGDGGQWSYFYDANGTITQIVDPYGGSTRFITDETGRVIQELDPNGNVTQLLYDGLGRHYARRDSFGHLLPTYEENPSPPDSLAYELPETPLEWEHGRLLAGTEMKRPSFDDAILQHVPPSVVHAFLQSDRADPQRIGANRVPEGLDDRIPLSTDEQGRPKEEVSEGAIARWKYDPNGNLTEHQDRDGALFRYEYESWNARHKEIDPLGHEIVYGHSAEGLVNRVTDSGATLTEYGYDLKDRLIEVRRHGRERERYSYDAAGNIIEKRDEQGRTLLKWEIARGSLDATRRLASGETHSFEYDEHGRIVVASTGESTCTFAFSADGRRLEDKRDGQGVAHEYKFGRLVATMYFDKFRVSYESRDYGDLVIADPTRARHRIRVSDAGLVAKYLANGVRELISYDSDGRCQRKAAVRDGERAMPWIRSFSYSRAGDLLRLADTERGTVRYCYDKAHRLTEEILPDGSQRRIEFDAAGNLLIQPGLMAVEMDSGNRLRSANGDRFTYNDRNHLSAREGPNGRTRYEYNSLDMLVRCEINGESWTANYDALCRRVSKSWRGRTATYYWDGFRLAAEVRHNGSLRMYLYEEDTALVPFMFVEYASLDSEPASGNRYYIFTNQIGVPIRVEDDSGRSRWSARVDPYGSAKFGPESSLEMPLRFPGHYYDPETCLHYNRFRYFSPELGRYLQADPAGLEGGINLYAYPMNPLTGTDIDGLGKPESRASGKKAEGTPPGTAAGCPLRSPPGATSGGPPAGRLTRQELQDAADYIRHGGGPRPHDWSSLTVTEGMVNGHPVYTVTSSRRPGSGRDNTDHNLTDGERARARERLGPNVNMPIEDRSPAGPASHHSEQRGIRATEDQTDRRQATSNQTATTRRDPDVGHMGAACTHCAERQNQSGVENVTGTIAGGGRIPDSQRRQQG